VNFMVAQVKSTSELKLVLPILAIAGRIQIFTAPDQTFYVDVIAQALRLGGQGSAVAIIQFFKGGIHQGVNSPRRLGQNLAWIRADLSRNIKADSILSADEAKSILDLWAWVKSSLFEGGYTLIILEDLNLAIKRSLISESEVIETLKSRPPELDIILMGANISDSLINIADQVTQHRY
jgi:cob(I)alamin adenosyltransferase